MRHFLVRGFRSPVGLSVVLVSASILFLIGCQPERSTNPSLRAVPDLILSSALSTDGHTLDDRFADLVDQIPGFGGLFYDSSGHLTIYLKDPGALGLARPGVAQFLLKGGRQTPERVTRVSSQTQDMRVLQGRYDFRELLSLYRTRILPNLHSIGKVTLTDIDEVKNRITVGVKEPSMIATARQTLHGLAIPSDALEVIQFGEAKALTSPALTRRRASRSSTSSYHLDDDLRPMYGGTRIEDYAVGGCTAGFNLVPWINGDTTSDRYFVTASHCVHPESSTGGNQTTQVSQAYANSGVIGVKWADHWWLTHDSTSTCPTGGYSCRNSDAALVKFGTASNGAYRTVAFAGYGSTEFGSTITITDIEEPYYGQPVQMIGAASGRLTGHITHSCANVYFGSYVYLCQGIADFEADQGDSGAPVISLTGGSTVYGIGIVHHIANGETVFGSLTASLGELYRAAPSLGIMDPTATAPSYAAPLSVSITGPSTVGPNNRTCTQWIAVVSGGSSPYQYSWTGLFTSTEYFVGGTVPESGGDLLVVVTDSNGAEVSLGLHISYDSNDLDYCT